MSLLVLFVRIVSELVRNELGAGCVVFVKSTMIASTIKNHIKVDMPVQISMCIMIAPWPRNLPRGQYQPRS